MKKPALDYSVHYFALNDESQTRIVFERYDQILKPHLPENRLLPILDVGSGMGFALRYLQERGYHNVEGAQVPNANAIVASHRSSFTEQAVETMLKAAELREVRISPLETPLRDEFYRALKALSPKRVVRALFRKMYRWIRVLILKLESPYPISGMLSLNLLAVGTRKKEPA